MVSSLVGYLHRSHRGPGLFEDTLSLGFQVVPIYIYKSKHRKKSLWLDLDLGFCLGEIELAQRIRQDERLISWLVMYRYAGKTIKGRIVAHAAKVLMSISIG